MMKRLGRFEEMSEVDLLGFEIVCIQILKPLAVSNPHSAPDLDHWLPSHRHFLFSGGVSIHQPLMIK
jgi:hypothetical protein